MSWLVMVGNGPDRHDTNRRIRVVYGSGRVARIGAVVEDGAVIQGKPS